jgi:hypothetical protein
MHGQHEHPAAAIDAGELVLPNLQHVARRLNGAIIASQPPLEEWGIVKKPTDRQLDEGLSSSPAWMHIGEIVVHEVARIEKAIFLQ